jgi:Fe-S-cluster containining protein
LENLVAVITFNSQNQAVIELGPEKFRFSCKRCASLCCRLGGPVLSKGELEKIEAAGNTLADFVESVDGAEDCSLLDCGRLKSRYDGSCVFLSVDDEKQRHFCSVYDARPSLCRLYPFSFKRLDSNNFALKIIPCCLGLNSTDGELIDQKYISGRLLEPLIEAMKLL